MARSQAAPPRPLFPDEHALSLDGQYCLNQRRAVALARRPFFFEIRPSQIREFLWRKNGVQILPVTAARGQFRSVSVDNQIFASKRRQGYVYFICHMEYTYRRRSFSSLLDILLTDR
jgi:hypothetical protein